MSVGRFFNAERELEKAWGHILHEHFVGGGGLAVKSKFSTGLSELCVWELILLTLDFPCETKNQFRFGGPGGFTSKLLFYKSFPCVVGTRGEKNILVVTHGPKIITAYPIFR